MRLSVRRLACHPVAALCLAAIACAPTTAVPAPTPAERPAAPATAPLQAVVEQARKEGALTLVWGEGSVGGTDGVRRLAEGYNRYYGLNLTVSFTPGPSMGNLVARLMQEYQAGRPATSDVIIGYGNHMAALLHAGVLEASDWTSWAPDVPSSEQAAGGGVAIPIQSSILGITYNSGRLRADDVPRSLYDLLKPSLKERIAGQNAVAGFDQLSMPEMWGEQRVREYMAQYAEQVAGVIRCNEKQRIASGEFDVFALDCSHGETLGLKQQGVPLDFAVASDAPLMKPIYMAVPKHATHPQAAKLWVNYLLTREAQDTIYSVDMMDNHRLPGSRTAADVERLQSGVSRFYEGDVDFFLRVDEQQVDALRAELVRMLKRS